MLLPSHLKIVTFRVGPTSSWFNNHDKGVRVTHIPTGMYIESTTLRSQVANRHKAILDMRRLVDELLPNFYTPTTVIQ